MGTRVVPKNVRMTIVPRKNVAVRAMFVRNWEC